MGRPTNEQILKSFTSKSDLTITAMSNNGGYLQDEQVKEFIKDIIDQPTILNEISVEPMASHTKEFSKIGITGRVLKPATVGDHTANVTHTVLTTDKVEIATVKFRGVVELGDDELQDNVEGGTLASKVRQMFVEQVPLDLEEILIQGDTGSADTFLLKKDGLLKLCSTRVVPLTVGTINRVPFKSAIRAMPAKYKRVLGDLRFYLSPDVTEEYADFLAARETGLGDTLHVQSFKQELNYRGVPMRNCVFMPSSQGLLVSPMNIKLGYWRQMRLEIQRYAEEEITKFYLSMRVGWNYLEEDAVVKITGLTPNSGISTTS